MLASVGLGAIAAQPPSPAGAEAPLWTKARRGVGLGTQRVVWSVPAPSVCLTFDDGPDPEITPKALEILRRYDVPALFMLVGAFVERHPAVVDAILAGGHLVGNHTWSHDSLLVLPPEEVRRQLHDTHHALLRHVDLVEWFRPPRGELSGVALQAAAELGYDVLLWGTEELEPLVPGTVAVWHDGLGHRGVVLPSGHPRREERRAGRLRQVGQLPAAIEDALERGARFVSVTEATATPRPLS